MSIRLMTQVWDSALQYNEKAICLALADWADDYGDSLYPSISHLAWKTGYKIRAVMFIMAKLKEAGIIDVTRAGGLRGGVRTNHYHFDARRLPIRPEWTPGGSADLALQGAALSAPRGSAVSAPRTVEVVQKLHHGSAGFAHDPLGDPSGDRASALPSAQAGHSFIDQPAMPVATDTGIDKGMDREQDTGIEVSREKGVQPVVPVSPYQATSPYRAIRALSAEQFNRYQKMRMYIRIDHVPPEDLEAAVSHFITGGRDFEQAWGHFQELLARGNDKGRLLLARLRAGYSHPMTPDEREQARSVLRAASAIRAARQPVSGI